MAKMTKEVMDAFNNPRAVKCLATISEDGKLNNVPVFSLAAGDEETLLFGDMFLDKTRKNLLKTKKVCAVAFVIRPEPGAPSIGFQVKGTFVEFVKSGPLYEMVSEITRKTMFRGVRGVGIIKVEEGYSVAPEKGPFKVF